LYVDVKVRLHRIRPRNATQRKTLRVARHRTTPCGAAASTCTICTVPLALRRAACCGILRHLRQKQCNLPYGAAYSHTVPHGNVVNKQVLTNDFNKETRFNFYTNSSQSWPDSTRRICDLTRADPWCVKLLTRPVVDPQLLSIVDPRIYNVLITE